MLRKMYEAELSGLQDEILALASMVETSVLASIDALERMDLTLARRLIRDDLRINAKRFEIEAGLLTLIATQGPIASDLRHVAALLEINTELERIGDYAKGNARVLLMVAPLSLEEPVLTIDIMGRKAMEMLREALDAFVRRDVEKALAIADRDDDVDALYERVYRHLLDEIVRDPVQIEQANHLLWIAHNLERAADRVTNICERTIFTVTGEMREIDMLAELPRDKASV